MIVAEFDMVKSAIGWPYSNNFYFPKIFLARGIKCQKLLTDGISLGVLGIIDFVKIKTINKKTAHG